MEHDERATAVTEKLVEAVREMPLGDLPRNESVRPFWHEIGHRSLLNWAEDMGRTLARIASAASTACAFPQSEEGAAAIEEALWRVDAGREKLEAIITLAFGVPALRLHKKGVLFSPDVKLIERKLSELASTHPAAGELAALGRELAEHPTVLMRNQLSHQLAPLPQVVEVCWIDIAFLKGGAIVGWGGGPLYPEAALDRGDIGAEAVWTFAVEKVEEALDLLLRAAELLAELIAAVATLEPPQPVYKDMDTGRLSLTDPRTTRL